jgi:hypothetical protein
VDLSIPAQAEEKDGKRIVTLNSLALAKQTLQAFKKFKAEVEEGKNTELLSNIIKARDHKITVVPEITNQFNIEFERLIKDQS